MRSATGSTQGPVRVLAVLLMALPVMALSMMSLLVAMNASAYPGGTPDFQTDVAPFCAACHSSTSLADLAGSAERAEKEMAAAKHLAPILAGEGGYGELSEADRATLVSHIKAVDANATIELDLPPIVIAGEDFQVTVNVTGGAGPVVGVALVDRPHRWFARPASSSGWQIIGAPTVIGPDGKPQSRWLSARTGVIDQGITYVNVTGVKGDAATGVWSKAKVIFTLKAPETPGDYPLGSVYFYGTEKASALGFTMHPIAGYAVPRGGYLGKSGRVKFSEAKVLTVRSPTPAD